MAETLDPTVSRITLVTTGDDERLEQIEKQLNKLLAQPAQTPAGD